MLDKYTIGDVDRISPEAPVPIVKKSKEYVVLGGCGNVIRNLDQLDCKVYCKTIVGMGIHGKYLMRKLSELKYFDDVFVKQSILYNTTVKERIISEYRFTQMLRIDTESKSPQIIFTENELDDIKTMDIDIIIISDYNKGVITLELMNQVRKLNIPFIVDPKPSNDHMYFDAYAITPNDIEYIKMLNSDNAQEFKTYRYIIHTMGAKGIEIINNANGSKIVIEADPVEVFNVSGAGDTVISIIAFCIAKKNDMITACHIANECAHYVVTKPGTSVVPTETFNEIYIECGGV